MVNLVMHVKEDIAKTSKKITKIIKKEYNLFQRLYRAAIYNLWILVRKEDTPKSIAHGMALGLFVGFLPIIPLQTVIILIVCSLTKTNKVAGVIGTSIFTNIFNAPITFYLQHFIGKIFIDVNVSFAEFAGLFKHLNVKTIAHFGFDLYLAIVIGGIILGIIFYPLSYKLTYSIIVKFRKRRDDRRKAKREERESNGIFFHSKNKIKIK